MDYFFSVVIPVYNSEKFLKKTINSVIKQKNNNTELIIVNDNSTDKSKNICLYYKKKFDFIKLINNKKNLGVGYCRNLAIKNTKGKYIIFLDSDDVLIENSLNKLEQFIKKKNFPDVIPIRFQKITFPQNNYKFIKDNKYNFNVRNLINYVLMKKIPFSDCWFFVIKKIFLKKNDICFPNSRFGESEIFVAKIICYMKSFACFQEKFYHKKDRLNSLTHSSDYNTTSSVLNNLIQFNIFYYKNNFNPLKRKFLKNYIQGIFGVFTALILLRKKDEIKSLSLLLNKNKHKIKKLKKYPEKINLKILINKHGAYKGLFKFLDLISENKFSSLEKINFNKKIIFTYCRSQYTAATIRILLKKNIKVKGVIDDNKDFLNTKFMDFKTIGSKNVFNNFKDNLNNVIIIITHQKTNTTRKISEFLYKNKILKKNIYSIKY